MAIPGRCDISINRINAFIGSSVGLFVEGVAVGSGEWGVGVRSWLPATKERRKEGRKEGRKRRKEGRKQPTNQRSIAAKATP